MLNPHQTYSLQTPPTVQLVVFSASRACPSVHKASDVRGGRVFCLFFRCLCHSQGTVAKPRVTQG